MTTRHQVKRLLIIILVLGGVGFGAREIFYARNIEQHPVVIKLSNEELIKRSDLIIRGTVIKSNGFERMTDPAGELTVGTRWTVQVDETLKGAPKESVVVKTFGGRVGLTEVWIEDQPVFIEGEQAILFLREKGEPGEYEPVGMFQGHFTINGDQAVQQETKESKPLIELEALIQTQ